MNGRNRLGRLGSGAERGRTRRGRERVAFLVDLGLPGPMMVADDRTPVWFEPSSDQSGVDKEMASEVVLDGPVAGGLVPAAVAHVPFLVEKLALVYELLPAEGPERSIAVLSLLEAGPGGEETSQIATAVESGDPGETPVTEPGEAAGPDAVNDEELAVFYTDEYVQSMRLWNAAGGTGEEWYKAIGDILSPAIEAAFRADGGLPSGLRAFADTLLRDVRAASDHVRQRLSDDESLSVTDRALTGEVSRMLNVASSPDFNVFADEAKYAPDCKRADIAG